MIKRSIPFLAILVLLLAACSAAAAPTPQALLAGKSASDGAVPAAAPPQAQSMELARSADTNSYAAGGADQTSGATTDATSTSASDSRLVIKNAELSLVVVDPVKSMDAIASLADQMGGYVVTSNAYKTQLSSGEEVPAANITIRVPAARLDEALATIKGQVKDANTDILTENISGQDVTKDYTDLQSRLTNLQQAEAQLREIMASATKPDDVLTVFNQLTQVREQIEVIQGQIKYYEEFRRYVRHQHAACRRGFGAAPDGGRLAAGGRGPRRGADAAQRLAGGRQYRHLVRAVRPADAAGGGPAVRHSIPDHPRHSRAAQGPARGSPAGADGQRVRNS